MTGGDGTLAQFIVYMPFGEALVNEQLVTHHQPYKFTGKPLDIETGLYYFGARYYCPATARWYGVDPLASNAPGWTPYRYAFNNPTRFIDPTGLFESESEAHQWASDNNIRTGWLSRNRVEQGADGSWAINNRGQGISYFRDSSVDNLNVVGRGDDGVIQSALVTPEASNLSGGLGMTFDGFGGLGKGMVHSGGSFRITKGAYNSNRLSMRYYQSGWTGGSRAQITTYNMRRVGSRIGRGSLYGSLLLGAYNINEANIQDGRSFGYNTQVATAQTAGGVFGGWAGAKGGAAGGAIIGGILFPGVGALPGAIIGGVIGGVAVGWIGSEASGAAVNEIHYRK